MFSIQLYNDWHTLPFITSFENTVDQLRKQAIVVMHSWEIATTESITSVHIHNKDSIKYRVSMTHTKQKKAPCLLLCSSYDGEPHRLQLKHIIYIEYCINYAGIHELLIVVLTFHNHSSLDYFNKELCYFRPPCDSVTFIAVHVRPGLLSDTEKQQIYTKKNCLLHNERHKITFILRQIHYLENIRNTNFVRSKYMHFW